MTIKEIENRTGLARTNIRFYEAEGLISPPRLPNGYRDYSEEDAATLERVKLLRTLHMPLEDIKALRAGDQTLTQALSAHLERLEEEQADLARSRTVCQGMQREGAEFSTLDAPRYLLELDRQDAKELEADQLERVTAPWRRFFARTLDLNLYALLFSLLLLPLGIHGPVASLSQNSSFGKALFTLAALSAAYTGMLLLLEPLLLSRFGTTPGKALLGLRVTDPEGRRLTWREAFRRTLTVVSRGEGWYFFPYQLYRNLRSYRSCTAGGILPWEEDTTLHQKDKKGWRVAVCLLGLYLLCAPSMSWNVKPLSPPHHGDMTVAELAENYDWAADLYDLSPTWRLDQEGNWQENFSLWSGPTTAPPPLAYRLEDGQVTGVTYALSADVETYRSTEYTDQITALVLAFTQTQAGYDPYLGMTPLPYFPLLHALDDTMAPTFDLELYGVHVTCDSSLDTQADQGELRLVMEKLDTGEISVAQFCRDFNAMAAELPYNLGFALEPDGTWVNTDPPNTVYEDGPPTPPPPYVFAEEKGIMTGLSFAGEVPLHLYRSGAYGLHSALAMEVFLESREGYPWWLTTTPLEELLVEVDPYQAQLEDSLYGVHLTWRTQTARDAAGQETITVDFRMETE